MNLRRHVAGLMIFSTVLGSSIFVYHFLTVPNAVIPSVPLRPLIANPVESIHITYTVRQVSIDFNHSTKYTALSLKLRPGHPAPEKLWISTRYFSPEINRHGDLASITEFRQPFAKGDEIEIVATDSWNSGKAVGGPRVAYFAHVYVWTGDDANSYPPDLPIDRNITIAEPVVVHWPDEILPARPDAVTFEKHAR